MLKKIVSNKKGLSMVEVIIGAGLLGVAVIGYMKVVGVNQSQLNTFTESIQLMKLRGRIQKNFSKESLCMDLLEGTTFATLRNSDVEFSQAAPGENEDLEAILPSSTKSFFLENITIYALEAPYVPFNVAGMASWDSHDVRADVSVVIKKKESSKRKYTYRSDEVIVAPRSNPMSIMISFGNDGAIKSCYLRNSRDLAMASYTCNEMGGILKAGKCLFPIFEGNPAQPNSFYRINKGLHEDDVRLVTLQQLICKLEKSVVAVEAAGVPPIMNGAAVVPLAEGRDPLFGLTKYCPHPQGARANAMNPANWHFVDDGF